jgi:hypothetical protein
MPKLTLNDLMEELANDPELNTRDKKRARAFLRINEAGSVKALLGKEKKSDGAADEGGTSAFQVR